MTENEAREAIKLEGGLEITGSPARLVKFFEGLEVADKALEEVQQYRDTKLSPKQVRTLQEDVTEYILQADEYRAIGTVEECRAAVEKSRKIAVLLKREEEREKSRAVIKQLAELVIPQITKEGGNDGRQSDSGTVFKSVEHSTEQTGTIRRRRR